MAEVTLEEAPRKIRDMYEKAYGAMERGNTKYAIDMFLNILDLEPRLFMARKLLRAGQVKVFKEKGGGSSTHIMSSLSGIGGLLGANSALKKDPLKALKITEKLLTTDPLNKMFINVHVQAALKADMPEVAILMLEVAREFYPKDIDLLKRLGKLYLDNEMTNKGRDVYEALLALKPNDPVILKAYKDASALDTMNKGGWSGASSYRDMIKDTAEATRLEQEAKSTKTAKDVDTLIADGLAKIEREPENINYRRSLAELYVRAGRMDEALETLNKAQEMSGGADPQIERTISSVKLKKFDQEVAALKEAGDETGAEAKQAERDAFELSEAEDRVKRYPNDLLFRYELGVLLYENGRTTEAIQQFQQSQRNPQRRNRSLYYMAMCFKSKQQYDIALEQLEKAASEMQILDETKKDILYELGVICEAMDNKEKAAKYFKEIYSVDIGYRDVAEKIEKGYS